MNKVPKQAMSVGVATIMDSHEVIIQAFGHKKARALKHGVEGCYSHEWTISALQVHPAGIIVADEAAVGELKVSTYRYFRELEKSERSVKSRGATQRSLCLADSGHTEGVSELRTLPLSFPPSQGRFDCGVSSGEVCRFSRGGRCPEFLFLTAGARRVGSGKEASGRRAGPRFAARPM